MDWGVPDWKREADYSMPDDLHQLQWWWEFLRRRGDYRDLWLKWSPINNRRIEKERAIWNRIATEQGDKPAELISSLMQTAPTDDPDSLREKYELSVLLDPSVSHDIGTLQHHRYPRSGTFNLWKAKPHFMDDEADKGRFHICFDIGSPIEAQIDKARQTLERLQIEYEGKKLVRRSHKANWPLYLRLLDAKDAGASLSQMSEILPAKMARRDARAAGNALKQAQDQAFRF